jgi:AraC-like DNA-binding protein
MERDTVAMHFVGAAVARLDPIARTRVLSAVSIPESLLAARHARVPARAFSALWLAISRELDDEFFGLDSRRMKMGSFALLCHAVLASANIDRAVRHILRGFGVLLDDIEGSLSLQDQHAVITIENRMSGPAARRFADETFLVMVHGLTCWLAGKRIPLQSTQFAYPKPEHAAEYATMFSEHSSFDAMRTEVRFDARLLAAPVVQRPGTLKAFLRGAPQSVFLRYKNEGSLTARLRRHLRKFVGQAEWPGLEQVAQEFHVSPTTLRRRLETELASYQGLKDEIRRDAAIHLLCTTGLSVADIAALVGFQEASAFHRAFKTWIGVQPGEYRRRRTQTSTSSLVRRQHQIATEPL